MRYRVFQLKFSKKVLPSLNRNSRIFPGIPGKVVDISRNPGKPKSPGNISLYFCAIFIRKSQNVPVKMWCSTRRLTAIFPDVRLTTKIWLNNRFGSLLWKNALRQQQRHHSRGIYATTFKKQTVFSRSATAATNLSRRLFCRNGVASYTISHITLKKTALFIHFIFTDFCSK